MADDTPPSPDWEAVKDDYFGGLKLTELCARHACTRQQFEAYRKKAGWPMRNKVPVSREKLVGRILHLMNQHLNAMESNMKPGNHSDITILNQLASSLGRLIRLEGGAKTGPRSEGRDLQDIREKLVRRIEELKRN
jgi:hypothetical protein